MTVHVWTESRLVTQENITMKSSSPFNLYNCYGATCTSSVGGLLQLPPNSLLYPHAIKPPNQHHKATAQNDKSETLWTILQPGGLRRGRAYLPSNTWKEWLQTQAPFHTRDPETQAEEEENNLVQPPVQRCMHCQHWQEISQTNRQ